MLLLNDLIPIHWAVAGAGIAAITLGMLFVAGKRLGMSTGFESLCSLVVSSPYFRRQALTSTQGWRLPMATGLVLGGLLSAWMSGGFHPTWALGMFDTSIGFGQVGKSIWMFGGGLLIGFGTRLAGGCTSGHGIFGISNLEASGLRATLAFMAAGLLTTQLVYRIVFAS